MKKLKMIILLLVMSVLVVGCTRSSHISIMSSNSSRDGVLKGSHWYMSGHYSRTISLEKGSILEVEFNADSKMGQITMEVTDFKGNMLYEIQPNIGIKQVEIKEDGRYTLKVKGKRHSGSYEITYEVES